MELWTELRFVNYQRTHMFSAGQSIPEYTHSAVAVQAHPRRCIGASSRMEFNGDAICNMPCGVSDAEATIPLAYLRGRARFSGSAPTS